MNIPSVQDGTLILKELGETDFRVLDFLEGTAGLDEEELASTAELTLSDLRVSLGRLEDFGLVKIVPAEPHRNTFVLDKEAFERLLRLT